MVFSPQFFQLPKTCPDYAKGGLQHDLLPGLFGHVSRRWRRGEAPGKMRIWMKLVSTKRLEDPHLIWIWTIRHVYQPMGIRNWMVLLCGDSTWLLENLWRTVSIHGYFASPFWNGVVKIVHAWLQGGIYCNNYAYVYIGWTADTFAPQPSLTLFVWSRLTNSFGFSLKAKARAQLPSSPVFPSQVRNLPRTCQGADIISAIEMGWWSSMTFTNFSSGATIRDFYGSTDTPRNITVNTPMVWSHRYVNPLLKGTVYLNDRISKWTSGLPAPKPRHRSSSRGGGWGVANNVMSPASCGNLQHALALDATLCNFSWNLQHALQLLLEITNIKPKSCD